MSFLQRLVAFLEGRTGRLRFWVAFAAFLVVAVVAYALTNASYRASLDDLYRFGRWSFSGADLAIFIPTIVTWFAVVVVSVRRLHDINRSAWWLLPFWIIPTLLPFFGSLFYPDVVPVGSIRLTDVISFFLLVWGLIELGGREGTTGPNRYGPDPSHPEIATAIPVLPGPGIAGIGQFAIGGLSWSSLLVIAGLLVIAIGVPLSVDNPNSPFYLSTNDTLLYGKYLCYGLLALSIGLIWGYGGILSLGHGAFFAIGGYALGMYLMRSIGSRGVYGNPILPDFMVFLNWSELPWFWHGFNAFWFSALMVVLVPGLLAFLFGWFAFRSRVTGVYLSIITQALTYALYLLFLRNATAVGGNNGFTDFKDILGAPVGSPETRGWLFASSAIALAIGYWICRSVVFSKYGKVIVAVRDAESRTRFLGYRVDRYKVFLFTLSACMAGVAGALYVPQVGIINPGELSPLKSIEAVVWVAVGGRGTLVGPMLGGVLVNAFKTYFTGGASQPYWVIAILPALALVFLVGIYRSAMGWLKVLIGAAAGAAIVAFGLVLSDTWVFPSRDVHFFGGILSAESWGWTVAVVAIIAWLTANKNKYIAGAIFGALLCRLLIDPDRMLALAPNWPYFLGALFIAVTLLLPRGIVGTIAYGWNAWRARRASIDAQEGRDADLTDPEPARILPDGSPSESPEAETKPPAGAVATQASS